LSSLGHEVFAPSRSSNDWLDADLGHVLYCAGLTADYAARPWDTIEAHVSLLARVLTQSTCQSLVYLSSTRLYDGQALDVVDESTPLLLSPQNPRHLYDLTKACGEAACAALGRGKARVARLSCVYRDADDPDGFLGALFRSLLLRKHTGATDMAAPLAVTASPDSVRDYVHLSDAVDAILAIANEGQQLIYNVASGENMSNQQLFEELTQISGIPIHATLPAQQTARAARVCVMAMNQGFGWKPRSVSATFEALWKAAA
jgi:nucleoside-diphosphate-sugar epimerase